MNLFAQHNKKIVPVLLVLTLTLMIFPAKAAEIAKPEASADEGLLLALGIINEENPLSEMVTREEFANVVVNMLGMQGVYGSGEKNDDGYAVSDLGAAVQYCVSNGYMLKKNGALNANYPVLQSDAVYALLKVLGYGNLILKPEGVIKYGSSSGLIDKISYNPDYPVQKEEMLVLVNNALCADIISVKKEENGQLSASEEKLSFLSKRFDVYIVKGVVSATQYGALGFNTKTEKNMLVLDGAEYECKNINTLELLGKYVKLYYRFDEKEDRYATLWIEEKNNTVLTISDEDIAEGSNRANFSYYKNGRQISASISSTADLIINGKNTAFDSGFELKIPGSRVTLIDSNSGGFDTVIVQSYINYYVSKTDEDSMSVYDVYGQNALCLENTGMISVVKDGKTATFSDIKKGSCISVVADNIKIGANGEKYISGDTEYALVFINTTKINGNLSSYTDDELKIDGIYYYLGENISYGIKKGALTKINTTGAISVYIDMAGKIMHYEIMSKLASQYAYLMRVSYDNDSDIAYVKLLGADGVIRTFDIYEKAAIDGDKIRDRKAQIDLLSSAEGIVKYSTNADGQISNIDTSYFNAAKEEKLTCIDKFYESRGETLYYNASCGKVFGGKVILGTSPIVFVIPADAENDDEYYVSDEGFFGSSGDFVIDAYNSSVRVSNLIVAYDSGNFQNTLPAFIVSKVSECVLESGDMASMITGLENGVEKTLYIDENAVNVYSGTSKTPIDGFMAGTLKQGDVLRYIAGKNGILSSIQIVSQPTDYAVSSSNYDASFRTVYAKAYESKENVLCVSTDGLCDSPDNTEVFDLSKADIYLIENDRIEKIDVLDIQTYKPCESVADSDDVFIFSSRSAAKIVVVKR